MKYADKQNEKIKSIDENTLVIGCDVAKHTHVARAFDFRGIELGKTLPFENSGNGFRSLVLLVETLQKGHQKTKVILGVEPTGHYWISLAEFIQTQTVIQLAMVNPHHTKKSKELDDNSPTKNDAKDAKVIAKLITEGRYWIPNIPQGDYGELRAGMSQYYYLQSSLTSLRGRIHAWLDRYFPEFLTVFKDFQGKVALATLRNFPLPQDILSLNNQDVIDIWRKQVVRCTGLKKAIALQEAARHSIGSKNGHQLARLEIQNLLVQYDLIKEQIDNLLSSLEIILSRLPESKSMLSIPGVGVITVAGFLAETGDLKKYTHWRQICRLAGLNLKENTSGKHVGKTTITKRGRPQLRALLFRSALVLVSKNPEIKALHNYFTTRKENQLKKMQSMVAICGKLVRLLFALGRKTECIYQSDKALGQERLQQIQKAAV